MSISKRSAVILIFGAAANHLASQAATADFVGLRVESASSEVGTPGCLDTYRIFALFDEPENRLLAVGADPGQNFVLNFFGGEIVNDSDSKVAGTIAEDLPSVPIGAAWDSFFTIGSNPLIGNDTFISPGFAGGDGVSAVLVGSLVEASEGGWFDSNPATPENGGAVLIMQLTVDPSECQFVDIQGAAFWEAEDPGPPRTSWFSSVFYCGTCDGDVDGSQVVDFDDLLIILSTWGPCEDTCCRADLNTDGVIGLDDLLTVLEQWGFNCTP